MAIKKNVLFILIAAAAVLTAARGVSMRADHILYDKESLSFQYPKDWTLRESSGSTDKYFQVHVFGDIDKETGFGPSVTLTVYPKKISGGKFASLAEMLERYMADAKKIKGYALRKDEVVKLASGVMAQDLEMKYVLRLPLYKSSAKDEEIGERTLFFEKGPNLYILSHKNLDGRFASSASVFRNIVRTLRF